LWRRWTREPALRYAQAIAFAFPFGWTLGRLGCFLAHDHPGIRSESPLAVNYPDGARLDLGLLEALAMLALSIVFLRLRTRAPTALPYLGLLCVYYGCVRFGLDWLRIEETLRGIYEPRYLGMTLAQWFCPLLLSAGLWLLWRGKRRGVDCGVDSNQVLSTASRAEL
jgi:phosphatidylglycerol:prolipoprotein diacylglycerol transferase